MPQNSMKYKQYLGDAVYANFDGYYIILTTEDGIRTTNTIYLEPQALKALNSYTAWLQNVFNSESNPQGETSANAQ